MKYEIIKTEVFIVESTSEDSALMAINALQEEMDATDRDFDTAKHGNCSTYGKVITMAETTNVFAA